MKRLESLKVFKSTQKKKNFFLNNNNFRSNYYKSMFKIKMP